MPGRAFDSSAGQPPASFAAEIGASMTTAIAPSADLVAIRLPDPAQPWLYSDRLLVIAPATATRLAVAGGPPVALAGGVAVVSAKVPAKLSLSALDRNGATVARLTVAEPDADGFLFNQPRVKRW